MVLCLNRQRVLSMRHETVFFSVGLTITFFDFIYAGCLR